MSKPDMSEEISKELKSAMLWTLAFGPIMAGYIATAGIVLSALIGWFAVPLGFPEVSAPHVLGLWFLAILVRVMMRRAVSEESEDDFPAKAYAVRYLWRILGFWAAWSVSFWMATLGGLL